MHTAILYQKSDDRIHCFLCPWQCKIAEGKSGVCGIRQNNGGKLFATGYGQVVSIAADPIEKKPLFNFHPGTKVMSVGSLGCNLCCKHCQNWEISQIKEAGAIRKTTYIEPELLIDQASHYNCKGIAWTYNEPSINIEYAIDGAKIAKENGLYTVFVTNGYITEQGLDAIGPYLDAYSVDIKGSDSFYRSIAGVQGIEPVLKATKRAKDMWNMHVEVTTNVIPTINDSDKELTETGKWIMDNLGPDCAWHISRFYPQYKLAHLPATSPSTLSHARDIGLSLGLRYVYTGNIPGDKGENTYCPSCNNILIERTGFTANQINIENNKCKFCHTEVGIII
ncbi:MAG TPA: AmmeMemoRadiSam system radical SAM enzyme [Candidatus Margulisbacteria bacterium]|nr:MAG: AmmeMemoRadiSam system radical SAM enzyme [Candidatus Margulisbacteria bacterium GWE2_39_32]HCT86294.1 AmmeMemoRadiSam system radical SAM enzyme [Candidatus Margulisiibacteriota bacterium]